MQIDEALNLVIPLYRDDAEDATPYAWVHSTPIGREVFERYFRVLNAMFADVARVGRSAVRSSHLYLRDAARSVSASDADAERGCEPLLAEIKRLSNVAVAAAGVWDRMPLDDAIAQKCIADEDAREVMASLVFFMAASHISDRRERRHIIAGAASMSGSRITSLSDTAFFDSLPTSTVTAIGSASVPPVAPGMATATDKGGAVQTFSLPS